MNYREGNKQDMAPAPSWKKKILEPTEEIANSSGRHAKAQMKDSGGDYST